MYIDAHLHPADYLDLSASAGDTGNVDELFAQPVSLCCSAHDHIEYERHRRLFECTVCGDAGSPTTEIILKQKETHLQLSEKQHVLFSFGIHPQNPVTDEADFLYRLLQTRQIHAIGECGFDLFNDEYKRLLPMQQKVWDMQLRWAQEFQLPVVIHCRKALHLLFDSVPRLKKLPAVIFHGWGGSPQEATSFLKKGVNAYFSIGKAVLRGQKSVCAMAASFDSTRLLTETDAPYMRLKAEDYSQPRDIIAVTAQCAKLRKMGTGAIQQTGTDAVKQTGAAAIKRADTDAVKQTGDVAAKQTGVATIKRAGAGAIHKAAVISQYESCMAALEAIDISEDEVKEFSDTIARNFNCAFGLSD